ncbi:MAG TPA: AMP-binding protein [Melioribacteraceae bacterium]|nr:AMP-binding protein [Melioribacteraceae bacterium]
MKVISIDYEVFFYNLNSKLITSKSVIYNRESLLIKVIFDNNLIITGEAAPLPGFSKETLTDVIENLLNIIPEIKVINISLSLYEQLSYINSLCKVPSLSFALQSIFLKLNIITNHSSNEFTKNKKVLLNGLISLADEEPLKKTEELLNIGYKTIKYKIGINKFEEEYETLSLINKKFKNKLNIRLDVNNGFPLENLNEYFIKLNNITYEYIEDPINNLNKLNLLSDFVDSIALDSSIYNIGEIKELIIKYKIKTFIIKPTLLGNLVEIIKLLTDKKYKNIKFIISSTFESFYSAYILFYLASLKPEYAHGLDTFRMLEKQDNNFIFKNGYCSFNNTPNAIKYHKIKIKSNNLFKIFPAINKNNFNICFISENNKTSYCGLFDAINSNNYPFNLIKNTDIALFNNSLHNLTINLFKTLKHNSRPIIIDNKFNCINAKSLANEFGASYFLTENEVTKLNNNKDDNLDYELMLFTSGSTNLPKAVILSLKSIINSAKKFINYFNLSSQNTLLASLPFNHIGGLMIMFRGIIAGSQIIIPKSTNYKDIKLSLESNLIDYISLVPKQLADLIDDNTDLSKCKAVILGGAKADKKLIEKALNKGINLYKVYGSTETCSMITIASPQDLINNPLSSGKPFSNVDIFISSNGKLIKNSNIKGEIVIKSDTLYSYYKLPNFNKCEETDNNYLFYTKDFGYLDNDGNLIIESRVDDIIISGGENISPEEIRSKLLEINDINDAVVIGIDDEIWGQVPIAFLVNNKLINIETINNYLLLKLPKYKIPKKYIFIGEIPYNNNGKIDIKTLKAFLK